MDPVEQPVADEQGQVTFTKELKGMAEQVDKDIKPVYIEWKQKSWLQWYRNINEKIDR